MGSVTSDDRSSEDLTAQARIRNAAIAHFVRDGFQKANLRAIATDAGVSIGLIFHHFGNKAGLRKACDEYVLRIETGRAHAAGRPEKMAGLLAEFLAAPAEYRLLVRYLARAIQEDSPDAARFVETMVTESEAILRAGVADGSMHPSSDPRAQAVLALVFSLGVFTMPPALVRALGYDEFGPEVLHRLSTPTMELFTRGLYTDDTPLRMAERAWPDESTNPTTEGEAS